MKKIASLLVCLALLTGVLLCALPASAASAALSGPGTVRAGDTITLTLSANGTGILGGQVNSLSYDTSLLTYSKYTQKIASPWIVEPGAGSTIVFYDNNQNNPINSSKNILTLTFKVKSNIAVGTKISVKVSLTLSNGQTGSNVSATYSATVAAPLSGNTKLATLTVQNATLSPNFNADTKSYNTSVPFSTDKLQISATAAEKSAKVSIAQPTLVPGKTTDVSVTVKAESGATTTYVIHVKRAQDPNYKADTNNRLVGMVVEDYFLSPVFSPEQTSYVVWLPYETTAAKVEAIPESSLASVEVQGNSEPYKVGENKITVVCTAEDGSTKNYEILMMRQAEYPPQGTVSQTDSSLTQSSTVSQPEQAPAGFSGSSLPTWLAVALCVFVAACAFVAARMIPQRKPRESSFEPED